MSILHQTKDIHVRSDGRGEIDTTEIEHPIIESCPAPPMQVHPANKFTCKPLVLLSNDSTKRVARQQQTMYLRNEQLIVPPIGYKGLEKKHAPNVEPVGLFVQFH